MVSIDDFKRVNRIVGYERGSGDHRTAETAAGRWLW